MLQTTEGGVNTVTLCVELEVAPQGGLECPIFVSFSTSDDTARKSVDDLRGKVRILMLPDVFHSTQCTLQFSMMTTAPSALR